MSFRSRRSSAARKQLAARADLTQYTFDRFANDLEQVRRELGYGALNLYAGSYRHSSRPGVYA